MTQATAPRRLNAVYKDAGKSLLTIDLFAHRVTLKRDYSLDDVLLWLASVALGPARGLESEPWVYVEFLKDYAYDGIDAPIARLAPGALCVSFDLEATGDILLEIRGDNVFAGERHISHLDNFQALSTVTKVNQRSRADRLARPHDYFGKTLRNQICLALIAEHFPTPLDPYDTGEVLCSIYGRVSRLLDIGYASGASGAKSASEDMRKLWSALCNEWLVEPEHPYGTHALRLSPELAEVYRTFVPQGIQTMARQAVLAAGGLNPGILKEAALAVKNQKVGGSFHETLVSSQTISAIDAAIENHAPLELLRPMARKRQDKQRAASAA